MPAGYGCGMVSASSMAGWGMASSIGGGMIAGAAAGATAGGLSAALNGGNLGDGMLQGAGYGAISGGAFGAISGYYGDAWTPGRVGANALAGGGISELSGQGFGGGALFSFASSSSAYLYNTLAHYDVTWRGGRFVIAKNPETLPKEYAINFGFATLTPGVSKLDEGSWLSRFANHIPGINAVSGLHDVFQVALDPWGARNILNLPGTIPAAAITYSALMTDMGASAAFYSTPH